MPIALKYVIKFHIKTNRCLKNFWFVNCMNLQKIATKVNDIDAQEIERRKNIM